MPGSAVPCSGCTRAALRLVGGAVVIAHRHSGRWHTTVVPLAQLLALAAPPLDTNLGCVHSGEQQTPAAAGETGV